MTMVPPKRHAPHFSKRRPYCDDERPESALTAVADGVLRVADSPGASPTERLVSSVNAASVLNAHALI
ncbi:MAG: hypothetical protein QOK28_2186 [Actinomycetota bacterium]|jgi:hypothetical protein